MRQVIIVVLFLLVALLGGWSIVRACCGLEMGNTKYNGYYVEGSDGNCEGQEVFTKYGEVRINCIHTDLRGRVWSEY